MSNYGVFSGLYFPVFWLNTGKYGPEKTPYFGHFARSVHTDLFTLYWLKIFSVYAVHDDDKKAVKKSNWENFWKILAKRPS